MFSLRPWAIPRSLSLFSGSWYPHPSFFFFFFFNRQIFLFSLSTSMLVKALFLKWICFLFSPFHHFMSYTGSMGHLWRTGTALIALLKSYTPRVPSPKKRVVQKEKGLINQGGHILSSEFISIPSGQSYPAPMKRKKNPLLKLLCSLFYQATKC